MNLKIDRNITTVFILPIACSSLHRFNYSFQIILATLQRDMAQNCSVYLISISGHTPPFSGINNRLSMILYIFTSVSTVWAKNNYFHVIIFPTALVL